ncbi:MAG: type II secretion system protein [Planctomycetales bacterium]|nr:type II secretion system protein [Planctomycetales bacterium]
MLKPISNQPFLYFPIMQPSNSKSRRAYTLLELMIALGLLGALMSVAWSLMATFRDSEERGWKITRRTQILRAAHAWLQSDAQAMLGPSQEFSFTGNSLGFSATIAPSLDPLPFLERLLSDASASDDLDSRYATARSGQEPTGGSAPLLESLASMDRELSETLAGSSPWTPEQVQIEYELLPVNIARPIDSTVTSRPAATRELDEIQFMLVRRELIGGTQSSSAQTSSMQSTVQGNAMDSTQGISPSDRVLTGQDLYRQNDDRQQLRGIPVTQSRLEGLIRPQFQYCDGLSWKDSWNSRSDGGLPAAIALRFDFPARAQMQPPQPRRTREAWEAEAEFELQESTELSAAELALAGEAEAELETDADASLMESDQFEVQMVIMVAGRAARPAHTLGGANSPAAMDSTGNSELVSPLSSTDMQSSGLRGGF